MTDSPADPSTVPDLPPAAFPRFGGADVYHGDCLRILRAMPDRSVHAVVTDPPYAIQPPGAGDGTQLVGVSPVDAARSTEVCDAVNLDAGLEAQLMNSAMLGQQSLNYSEKETHSRGYADNDSAWFQRWCSLWLAECLRVLKPGGHLVAFGGTRSAHRLFCAAEDAGFEIRDQLIWLYGTGAPKSMNVGDAARTSATRHGLNSSAGGSLDGYDGWWTGIKPAHEPVLLARKPLEGRVVDNVAAHGAGALNVAGCMVVDTAGNEQGALAFEPDYPQGRGRVADPARWPSNVLLDRDTAAYLDEAAGSAVSRYFWVAKPATAERVSVGGVSHPTVKPLALIQRLVRLVTPAGGTVLDPFGGSGTTAEACLLEGFSSITVEREAAYIPLIRYRLDRRLDPVRAVMTEGEGSDDLFGLLEDLG